MTALSRELLANLKNRLDRAYALYGSFTSHLCPRCGTGMQVADSAAHMAASVFFKGNYVVMQCCSYSSDPGDWCDYSSMPGEFCLKVRGRRLP